MSIKSDKWISEMSKNKKMIEPFSENQVRIDEKGDKLISYGVSSYGYDVRCSNEFKVFTNIHSAIVDPKSFDEKSQKWFFSVIDVVAALTGQSDYKKAKSYWSTLKSRLDKEGSEVVTNCDQLLGFFFS